jgi:hypothetical protein
VPKLIETIENTIDSEDFQERHKESSKDFIRNTALSFKNLIAFFANLNKGSYETELKAFYKTINNQEVANPEVTKGAVSKARKKLKPSAFIELNEKTVQEYEQQAPLKTWYGMRPVGVDGSTVTVPDETEIKEHFGVWEGRHGDPCPKARISQMFDVLNHITLDAIIKPKSQGERELAADHFLKLMPSDLVLLDRGYPAAWLFSLILSLDANFCARVKISQWKVIKKFFRSGKTEKIVKLPMSYSSIRNCREMGLDIEPIKIRLIRIGLPSGETEILATSLLDQEKFAYDVFAELYHLRWPVEEDYKIMKCRIQVENFSGKTVRSVYQDFHAKVFSKNLTMMIANSVEPLVEKNTASRKYKYQVNFTQALSAIKNVIVLLILRPRDKIHSIIEDLQAVILKCVDAIRPDRSNKRIFKKRNKKFNPAYRQPA